MEWLLDMVRPNARAQLKQVMRMYNTKFTRKIKAVHANRRFSDTSGVSIIEGLVAAVILIVALVGFLTVAISTTNLGGKNARMMTANALIYDKYEFLKFQNFDNIVASAEPSIDVDANGNLVQGVFNRTVAVTQVDAGTPLTVAKNVSITVNWPGHSISQSSIFMR